MAEVRIRRAGRDDQRVVRDRLRRRKAAHRGKADLARIEIEARHLGQHHLHVAIALEQRAQRIGDLAGRQRPGRDLVGEWLEEMEVAPVHERDVHGRTAQSLDHLDAGEPAPDHHDTVLSHLGLREWRGRSHIPAFRAPASPGMPDPFCLAGAAWVRS
jgi:hypothetical protein